MDFKIPSFKEDKDLFDFLVKNEDDILYSKKQSYKKADGIGFSPIAMKSFGHKQQSISDLMAKDEIDVISIINTTKLLDSHTDVHIDGLWDKSLSENTKIKHLQEHQMSFDKIIADKEDLKAYVKNYTWKQLGYDAPGSTQALVFESKVRKDRNPYMFEQYAKGNVDNHSVGMRYVKLLTCINDEDYPVQLENYEKYAPMVANKEALEQAKYFWAVLEAKAIEGSAVPLGSNFVTPTQSIKSRETNNIKSSPYLSWLAN